MWRVYVLSALVACVVAAATAFVTVRLALPGGSLAQTVALEGEEWLEGGTEKVVYYKTPFASPPHLTTTPGGHPGQYRITDQNADSFKLIVTDSRSVTLRWRAEGQPAR